MKLEGRGESEGSEGRERRLRTGYPFLGDARNEVAGDRGEKGEQGEREERGGSAHWISRRNVEPDVPCSDGYPCGTVLNLRSTA